MHEYVTVVPGVNLSNHLNNQRPGNRPVVTKKWVRQVMGQHPEWDWYVVGGSAINGGDCLRGDITLQVVDRNDVGTVRAMVNFQADADRPFGYKAVVS